MYKVTIKESSFAEMSKKERMLLCDMAGASKIDEILATIDEVTFKPTAYAVLEVHNDRSRGDKDYVKYLYIDSDGNRYVSGSESLFTSFKYYFDEMQGETEDWAIAVTKQPSKNYTGKDFYTCYLV